MKPLAGKKIVSLAVNLPGPVAAMRLHSLGAKIVKIEPPTRDPIWAVAPSFYKFLNRGQKILTLDLKTQSGFKKADSLIRSADLLLTSSRPQSLEKLSLDWRTLHKRFPKLHYLALVGYPSPHQNKAGHDLTYQAEKGFIQPPYLPRTFLADLAGAQEAVIQALALFREKKGTYVEVSLAESLNLFSLPFREGLTAHGGILGGGLPQYNVYKARDGWIALAALESHFLLRLSALVKSDKINKQTLEAFFSAKTIQEWERWADENDLPLVAVK